MLQPGLATQVASGSSCCGCRQFFIRYCTSWGPKPFLLLCAQTFIVHLLRTERIPFISSCAAWPLMLSSFGTMAAGIAICYVPGLNGALSLEPIIPSYYGYLAATVAGYCMCTQIIKRLYIRVFNNWL